MRRNLCRKWRYCLCHNAMIASKYKTLTMRDVWAFSPLPTSYPNGNIF